MAATAKDLPYPVASDGRPHIDQAIAALAAAIDAVYDSLTDAQMALLAGADLWDGELRVQSDAGASRLWKGLYEYRTSGALWTPLVGLGAHASYVPTLTAVSVNPNVGTTPDSFGWYVQMGKRIFGRAHIQMGGTGIAGGTGSYRILLPVSCGLTGAPTIGRWYWSRPGSPGSTQMGVLQLVDATHAKMMFTDATTAGEMRSDTAAGVYVQASAYLSVQFLYRMT